MWETQPYVEEISVECRPFLDSPSLDNGGVQHAHAHVHTSLQSISALFSLKLW